jgi:hypothetical protein
MMDVVEDINTKFIPAYCSAFFCSRKNYKCFRRCGIIMYVPTLVSAIYQDASFSGPGEYSNLDRITLTMKLFQ